MDTRQQAILQAIVNEYIRTAEPVSSSLLTKKHGLNVSPATIRNDMAELEAAGLIRQPHTSAGRIPTEAGYKFYIEHDLNRQPDLAAKEQQVLKARARTATGSDEVLKNMAQALAELSLETVFVGFGPRDIYTAGISNLLNQPEVIADEAFLHQMSRMFDQIETVIARLFESNTTDEVRILIGRNNPFGAGLGTVLTRYVAPDHEGILGIIGPIRMDYEDNLARIAFARTLLNRS